MFGTSVKSYFFIGKYRAVSVFTHGVCERKPPDNGLFRDENAAATTPRHPTPESAHLLGSISLGETHLSRRRRRRRRRRRPLLGWGLSPASSLWLPLLETFCSIPLPLLDYPILWPIKSIWDPVSHWTHGGGCSTRGLLRRSAGGRVRGNHQVSIW